MEQKNKLKKQENVISYLPPQALDLEKAVIGAILIDREALPQVSDFLKSEMFYLEKHMLIFLAIENLYAQNNPVDTLTVTMELKRMGKLDAVGGPYEISVMSNSVGSSLHIQYHARIIFQKYILRKVIEVSNNASKLAYQEEVDALDILYKTQDVLRDLENGIVQDEVRAIDDVIEETFEQMRRAKGANGVLGLECHLTALNETICGFQKGFVHIIAGRPGMGKSALAKSITLSLVKKKIKCRFFSLEMTAPQLMIGFLSEALEINNNRVAKGDLLDDEWMKMEQLRLEFKNYLEIDATPAITIGYLEAQVRKAVAKGVQFIAIDYLQLMTLSKAESKNKIREQEISYLSSNIKRIAKQYNIPIVLLSQLSRAVEDRADKVPQLSDLRESGSIEQDAEVVIFCYRPQYYKLFEDRQGNSMRGLAKLIVAKNRFGPIEDIVTKFFPTLTKYDTFESSVKLEEIQPELPGISTPTEEQLNLL